MKISREVVHHVNLGNYEWIELRAGLEVETSIDAAEDDFKELTELLKRALDEEFEEARYLTVDPESYIHAVVEHRRKAANG